MRHPRVDSVRYPIWAANAGWRTYRFFIRFRDEAFRTSLQRWSTLGLDTPIATSFYISICLTADLESNWEECEARMATDSSHSSATSIALLLASCCASWKPTMIRGVVCGWFSAGRFLVSWKQRMPDFIWRSETGSGMLEISLPEEDTALGDLPLLGLHATTAHVLHRLGLSIHQLRRKLAYPKIRIPSAGNFTLLGESETWIRSQERHFLGIWKHISLLFHDWGTM